MPIDFEPAGPFAPDISASYGRAEMYLAQAPERMQIRALNANGGGGGGGGGGDVAQSAIAHNQMSLQGNLAEQGMNAEAQRWLADRQPSPRDAFQADAQAGLQQQHAQLQNWLSQQEMSQAEMMRMQRMKSAIGEIMNNDKLTPDEQTAMAFQMKTGIDLYQKRLENQKIQADQEKLKNDREQHAHLAGLRSTDSAIRAQTYQSMQIQPKGEDNKPLTGEDGKPVYGIILPDGKWQQTSVHKEPKDEKAEKAKKFEPFDSHKAEVNATAEANVEFPNEAKLVAGEQHSAEYVAHKKASFARQQREHFERTGHPAAGYAGLPASEAPTPVVPKPFQTSVPESQDAAQKAITSKYVESVQRLDAMTHIPPEQKTSAMVALHTRQQLMEKYGSEQAFAVHATPEDKAKWQQTAKTLEGVPKAPPAPDTRGAAEKFGAGDLVTTANIKDVAGKLASGDLVTLEKHAPGLKEKVDRALKAFNEGNLITGRELLDAINSANPFLRRR